MVFYKKHFTKPKIISFFELIQAMLILYRLALTAYAALIRMASLFNQKAKLFIQGRHNQRFKLEELEQISESRVWFHFASLGEFEQGRPVIEKWKNYYPEDKLIITFFSPSGYEIRKNYAGADAIFYLPMDSKAGSLKFIRQLKPRLAIFTKYDFWYYYFYYLHLGGIPLYMISVIFKPDQIFFSWYGGLFRKMLGSVSWFFVQDQTSVALLARNGIHNCSIAGDTRFDRVLTNYDQRKELPEIKLFRDTAPVLIAGSTWPQDEELLVTLFDQPGSTGWKFIIAPHETDAAHISSLMSKLPADAMQYSAWRECQMAARPAITPRILVIDNIGMLSSIYRYGDIAYIGGGFGSGIHNILEAGVFSIPVIFGPKHQKFKEALETRALQGSFSISNLAELSAAFSMLQNGHSRQAAGKIMGDYVLAGKGATDKIMQHITGDSTN